MVNCRKGHVNAPATRSGTCAICYKAYQKAYHREHRVEIAKRARERRQEWRELAIDHLGGKCVDCGISDHRVLEFDHLKDKEHKIAWLLDRNWELLLKELEKCELVCANCHAIRTYERRPK